ncbi:heme-binding protein [Rhodanobacter sp. FDAARGOS 1247]|nr:heme-binding protein [Rhodanobacter sp. FDAARGOS 1247]
MRNGCSARRRDATTERAGRGFVRAPHVRAGWKRGTRAGEGTCWSMVISAMFDGQLAGGIGISGGTAAQDHEAAEAAEAALRALGLPA